MKRKRRQRRSPRRTEVIVRKRVVEVQRVVNNFEMRVRWALANRGWNTADLAKACGWCRDYISKQLRNRQIPLEFFRRVSKALDIQDWESKTIPHRAWEWRVQGVAKAFERRADEIEANEKSAGHPSAKATGSRRPPKRARKAKAKE